MPPPPIASRWSASNRARTSGTADTVGIAPNELTSSDNRDELSGIPLHKHVLARIDVQAEQATGLGVGHWAMVTVLATPTQTTSDPNEKGTVPFVRIATLHHGHTVGIIGELEELGYPAGMGVER